ncbi:MAG TPA: MazG family protein [Candidatus Agrococcus pullicola]|uniref:MazG family protein n=1 Tax=Candidatus Agrococcus pullicola TaxID=2838429 RepID=A0A9D1YXE2_9MICO|nr:MazG family protein [Candidatus Agrococcus pullicola]
MRIMRAEDGCPWDREQTHASLVQYLLEESYELAEAIENSAADDELVEELGDVLFQVVFHSEIARADGRFDFERVAGAVADKMRARHPHVFGDAPRDIDSVKSNWERLKADEAGKRERKRVDDGVPVALPALQRAQKVLGRLERRDGVLPKAADSNVGSEEEFGDALLALVQTAREQGWDAERALRDAVRRLAEREF